MEVGLQALFGHAVGADAQLRELALRTPRAPGAGPGRRRIDRDDRRRGIADEARERIELDVRDARRTEVVAEHDEVEAVRRGDVDPEHDAVALAPRERDRLAMPLAPLVGARADGDAEPLVGDDVR